MCCYLLGPPYRVVLGSSVLLENLSAGEGEPFGCKYFPNSGYGSRRAIAMEESGEIRPSHLCSSEGALPLQKKIVTIETTTVISSSTTEGSVGGIPTSRNETVIVKTSTDESFAYDSETHRLLLNSIQKNVYTNGKLTRNESVVHRYSPVAEEKVAEFTSKTVVEYNEDGEVISSSPTSIEVSVQDGASSALNIPSSFESAVKYCGAPAQILLTSYSEDTFGTTTQGVAYTTIPCWILSEIQAYLSRHFCITPKIKEQISFTSLQLNPYTLIGKNVKLMGTLVKDSQGVYSLLEAKQLTPVGTKKVYIDDDERTVVGMTLTFTENNNVMTTIATCALLGQ
jgi:hypothetical protein